MSIKNDARIILKILPADGSPMTKGEIAMKMGENLGPVLEFLEQQGRINITYGDTTLISRTV